jgi:formiminotetrahydrofolate cyclodeaminase
MYKDMTFEEILNKISSTDPASAGGTVTTLVGALASALGYMVANYTISNGNDKDYENTLEVTLENLIDIKEKLMEYAEEASKYVERIKNVKEGKDKDNSLTAAAVFSFNVAKSCYKILKNCFTLYKYGNPVLKPEAKITCYLAWSALNSALISVEANLEKIKEAEVRENLLNDIIEFKNEADFLLKELKEEIKN